MARNRWTLALIIISLPILATVITAFRIRDLPKPHDSTKVETKKAQPCEHCDVKVGQKVHSVSIESDKHKYDDVKKEVRGKQQLISEKTLETKSTHSYDVKSDEGDNKDDLDFSKIESGFRQGHQKDSKLSKSESAAKLKSNVKKTNDDIKNKVIIDDDYDDDDDNDDNNNNNINKNHNKFKSNIPLKSKMPETRKAISNVNSDIERLKIKEAFKKHEAKRTVNSDDDDDEDDEVDNSDENEESVDIRTKNKAVNSKPNTAESKKTLPEIPKRDLKKIQIKVMESKKQKHGSQEDNNEDADDDDNDGEDNDDDDDYKGLENIDELFKILEMKPSPKVKKSSTGVEQKNKHHIEIKTHSPERSRNKNEIDDKYDHDNDDDDDDDDDEDNQDNKIVSRQEVKSAKNPPLSKNNTETSELSSKNNTDQPNNKQDQKYNSLSTDKSKSAKQSPLNEAKNSKKDEVSKAKPFFDSKQLDPVKKEVTKNDALDIKSYEKDKTDKHQTMTKNDNNSDDKKHRLDSTKTIEESEKVTNKAKTPVKEVKSSGLEVKKNYVDPKKDQTDRKDIFQTPEHGKDIKYDFEKPNAYKDSHKSFDYSDFEKMQVSKSHHKEKKKPKVSAEHDINSREENFLKHVSDALNRRNLLKSEFEDFYAFFPTFAPNFSRIHNPECRRHGQILLRQLRGTKLWALNMLDATAKIPSGVLQGNGIQLGDFDQCLGSRARVQLDTGSVVKVQGKYCLARLDVKAEHTELEAPVYLAQAKSLIRSRIDDPGHFVPRFSTLSWGVCVPSACDYEDVEVIVKDAFKHYQHKSGLILKVRVEENDCHTDEDDDWEEWLEFPTLLTLSFYGIIVLLVLVATIQDFIARRQPEEGEEDKAEETEIEQKVDTEENKETKKQSDGILSPFSLYHSIGKLIAPGTSNEISCIHGIRGIATVALLVAHKFMPVAVMPYTNRVKITELASSPLWSWCRAGWVFTDCFLLLSGALTSHRIASDNETGVVKRLFSRYLRLTPALLAVVLFYAYVWDKLSTGPMWGSFVTKNAQICEQGWWWNLLYVQNYFGLEDMCAPQTHQLALDMQLTILGGIVVWSMQSDIVFAKLVLPTIHLVSAYFRYTTVRDHRLTLLAYHGVSVSQLYRTARLSYISTLHRCSPYLIGISLGLALKKPAKHGKFLLTLGWVTSIGLSALVAWAGLDSGSTQYRYNAIFAAQYAAIAPLASAMAIAWVIYAVHSGTCDYLSKILSWRPLVFISRISYALYLCQFIIFITSIGTVRTSREFTLMSLIDVQEISAVLLSSIILTVTFVIPMQSLHKIFIFQWKSQSDVISEKESQNTKQKTAEDSQIEDKKEGPPPVRNRHNLVAHRETLEEIPEMEIEYESQRENNEVLDEIIEEEEGTFGEGEEHIDDLEIIEEEEAEEAGEEEAWLDREGERSYSREGDRDLDEWEWTANGSGRSGAQCYRYTR